MANGDDNNCNISEILNKDHNECVAISENSHKDQSECVANKGKNVLRQGQECVEIKIRIYNSFK